MIGPAEQGWSVALSADGKTAIVGGIVDKRLTGAAWVFTRSGDVWAQHGAKLIGTGAIGQAGQGCSVSISADGHTWPEGEDHRCYARIFRCQSVFGERPDRAEVSNTHG